MRRPQGHGREARRYSDGSSSQPSGSETQDLSLDSILHPAAGRRVASNAKLHRVQSCRLPTVRRIEGKVLVAFVDSKTKGNFQRSVRSGRPLAVTRNRHDTVSMRHL